MKLSALALFSVICSANAGARPSLSISVQDGTYDSLSGLDPTVSWSNSGTAGDLDIEYGIEASAAVTSDIASLPKNIWGKASGSVGGWGVSARAEFEGTDFTQASIDIDASDETSAVHVDASAGTSSFTVDKVTATKSFDADGGSVTVNPRYTVDGGDADVVVTYSKDDTSVEITASQTDQSITVSRQVDDENRLAPTVSSDGSFSVEWERSLGDDNSLTTTVTPNESIDLEWKDSEWTATINMALDGTDITGTSVSVKRDVSF